MDNNPESRTRPTLEVYGQVKARLNRLFMDCSKKSDTLDQMTTRGIMGKNFFGVMEWVLFYGAKFTEEQLVKIFRFPWSEDVLNGPCPFVKNKSVSQTHFAFLGIESSDGQNPLTIMEWSKIYDPGRRRARFSDDFPHDIYGSEPFARDVTCSLRWYLMPLEIVPKSTCLWYEEQKNMLPAEYEVPLAIEEVSKLFLYYKKNGGYINHTKWGRCRDISSNKFYVACGFFGEGGVNLDLCHDAIDARNYNFGVAASRKISD